MGEILPQDGLIACVVWLDSGNWMYVAANDAIPAGDSEIPVISVAEDSVSIFTGNATNRVPLISEEEKTALITAWENRKKAIESARLAAGRKVEEEEKKEALSQVIRHVPAVSQAGSSLPRTSRRLINITTPPQFFYGTEYRYPMFFETVPIMERGPSGAVVRRAMVAPQRFQSGCWGHGITIEDAGRSITIGR